MTPNDDSDGVDRPDDPVVEALLVIAGELRSIRQELQRDEPDAGEAASGVSLPEFSCRSCEETLQGEEAARKHARRSHGVPDDDWTILYPHDQTNQSDGSEESSGTDNQANGGEVNAN